MPSKFGLKLVLVFLTIQSVLTLLCTFNDTPEDANLNFTELASKYGFPSEEHDVATEDGYIIKLFHIPGNKAHPVLLMHGILDSADTFIIRGNTSLAVAMARAGYDVWVGNYRGNRYCRTHQRLNPDIDKQFWDFSFHEIGLYDLPANIDFILNKTGQTKLNCIGHSQGNTIFYVLGSMRPEYNDKINLLIALSPICYLYHLKPPSSTMMYMWPFVDKLLAFVGKDEAFSTESVEKFLIQTVCNLKGTYDICGKGFILAVSGMDTEELEPEFVRVIIGHYPSGTSRKTGTHLMQMALKMNFSQMDYGPQKNLAVYNSLSPPNYDLKKVTMRIALIAASNDGLSSLKDVKILKRQLPNVVEFRVLDWHLFNHVDYVWARNMNKHLFPTVFSLLERFVG